MYGVCSVLDLVFIMDVVVGKIKFLMGLLGIIDFLKYFGIFYDIFGIICKVVIF